MHPFLPPTSESAEDTGVPLHIGQMDDGQRAAYLWWLQTQEDTQAVTPVRNDCGCVDVDLTISFEIV